MCGICGLVSYPTADLDLLVTALTRVNHRGHEAVGIAATNGYDLQVFCETGYVREVCRPTVKTFKEFTDDVQKKRMAAFVGHTRYSTVGPSDVRHGQPLEMVRRDGRPFVLAHNGQLAMHAALRPRLEAVGMRFHTDSDSEVLAGAIAESRAQDLPEAVADVVREIPGVYALLALDAEFLVAARDQIGNRPLWFCARDRAVAFASEVAALPAWGVPAREVPPGAIVTVPLAAPTPVVRQIIPPAPGYCIFEALYFARPDQRIGADVAATIRRRLGQRLAAECPVAADAACAVPDSGNDAALGFAEASGVPFEPRIMVENWYTVSGRSFILPGPAQRDAAVRRKYSVTEDLVRGKRVVVVDDTIVRGNTAPVLTALLKDAGATEVHWRIAAAPIRHPCFFGIDIPTAAELIAAGRTEDGVRELVGATSLRYLPYAAMLDAVNGAREGWCTGCFTGTYPIPVPPH